MSENKGDSMKRWEYQDYKILQLIQCSGVLAVYAIENEAGGFKLESHPIRFMAVAEVETVYLEKPVNADLHAVGRKYQESEKENKVVGLELDYGAFEVCNEAENFAGYCMEGDDINDATAYLPSKFLRALDPTNGHHADK